MRKPIKIGITHGDYNGIGYEVIVKALSNPMMMELITPVVFGSRRLMEKAVKAFAPEPMQLLYVPSAAEAVEGKINVVDLRLPKEDLTPGVVSREAGAAAVAALEAACKALESGDIRALVTAPINKDAVQSEDFHFPGHTEYLESRLGGRAQMILFDDNVKVALVSTHLPVSRIPESITKERVYDSIVRLNETLRLDFALTRPRIAVLSLNPHCGDNGLLGSEEADFIAPAIAEAAGKGILAFGPYAADGFFGSGNYRNFDAVLAMYHDQGLAPFKTLAGSGGVNFTAGLEWVRTSPDHGTAYDKAWKGESDDASMREAIYKAVDLTRNRDTYRRISANPLRKARTEKEADKTIDLSKEEL